MANKSICSVDGCSKTAKVRGMCSGHNHKMQRYGDPLHCLRVPRGLAEAFFHNIVLPYEGKDCLIWPYGLTTHGYGRMTLNGKRGFVHRFACEAINGHPSSPDLQAAHKCGKGHLACVNPKHLLWKTQLENKADELTHGTRNRGERNGRAKLSDGHAREILSLKGKETQRAIATRFGVSHATVQIIHSGKKWQWLYE